jgi:hypothetical protein
MRSVPIDSVALRTAEEKIHALVNMVRYKVLYFLSFYAVKGFIALGAAGEGHIGHFMGEAG